VCWFTIDRKKAGVPSSKLYEGRTDEKIADVVGVGKDTLRKAKYIVEAVEDRSIVWSMTDWEDAEDFYEKYGPGTNPEASAKWLYVMRMHTLAGLHLKEGAGSIDPQ